MHGPPLGSDFKTNADGLQRMGKSAMLWSRSVSDCEAQGRKLLEKSHRLIDHAG